VFICLNMALPVAERASFLAVEPGKKSSSA